MLLQKFAKKFLQLQSKLWKMWNFFTDTANNKQYTVYKIILLAVINSNNTGTDTEIYQGGWLGRLA